MFLVKQILVRTPSSPSSHNQKEHVLANLMCMLLSNLTKSQEVARLLLQSDDACLMGFYVVNLMQIFERHLKVNDFHFLASVFANLTTVRLAHFSLIDCSIPRSSTKAGKLFLRQKATGMSTVP